MTRRGAQTLGCVMLTLVILVSSVWAVLALYYQVPLAAPWPMVVGGLWGLFAMAAIVLAWRGEAARAVLSYGVAFAMLLGWWGRIAPSNDRLWADDVAQQLSGKVEGNTVTLHNVRNFDWRSDADYTVRWETRRYNLDQLRSVDMAVSYWMGPAIGHTLVSFGFDDGQGGINQVVFSIEIRKERGEEFSAIAGFFKRFELSVIAADERDVLRVRTNARGEDVYLYRVAMPKATMRSLFLSYLDEAHAIAQKPSFYNTLTANCTTIVFNMAQHIIGGLPMDYRLLASGYLPEYLYDLGALTPGHDLASLRAAGRITDRAKAANDDPQFSQAIRRGIPGMEQGSKP